MPDQILDDDSFDSLEMDDMPSFDAADSAEQQEKEKTMSLREKLSLKHQNAGGTSPAPAAKSSKSSGKGRSGKGFLTPILLLLLVIVGILLLLQIRQLSDSINAAMLGAGTFDGSASIDANSSYDYAIDFILDPNLVDRMAARGREGWQVVGSRRTMDSTTGQYGYEFIFMRRIPGR